MFEMVDLFKDDIYKFRSYLTPAIRFFKTIFMRTRVYTLSLILCFGPFICSYSQSTKLYKKDSIELNIQFSRFQTAVLTTDTTTLVQLYTNDAVSLVQTNPILTGIESIMMRWRKAFKMPFQLKLNLQRMEISSGHKASCFGTFIIYSQSNEVLATGKWLQLWRREKEVWKLYLEMDNFNTSSNNQKKN